MDKREMLYYNCHNSIGGLGMTSRERKKILELERDIKKMQKDHEKTFEEFNRKKSLPARIADRLKFFLGKKPR